MTNDDDTNNNEDTKKIKGKPRQVKNVIPLGTMDIDVYATPKVSKALEEIKEDMTLYHGVRLAQVMEALYLQGRKDGARSAIDTLDNAIADAKGEISYRNPGKPPKPPAPPKPKKRTKPSK